MQDTTPSLDSSSSDQGSDFSQEDGTPAGVGSGVLTPGLSVAVRDRESDGSFEFSEYSDGSSGSGSGGTHEDFSSDFSDDGSKASESGGGRGEREAGGEVGGGGRAGGGSGDGSSDGEGRAASEAEDGGGRDGVEAVGARAGRSGSGRRLNILLVSDFFLPLLGGVELHQYQLAQGLLRRGHKVVLLTGTYRLDKGKEKEKGRGNRQGIRFMTNGLKVYYCPQLPISGQASLPTLFGLFPLFRNIVIREQIQIVHGHQTTSALAHECILHAKTMGIATVYTDHSLFGFADTPSIHLNKLMSFTLTGINQVICVSHCSKENIVLRARISPALCSVIPNAVDTSNFKPLSSLPCRVPAPNGDGTFNIVILSRLVYRKGIDLAVEVIPEICQRFPNVNFIIGGDGPKRINVEEMCERHQLQDRVHLLGAIPHSDVRSVLVKGHMFLNCSLTEAFCIAILEAVSCGLFVVSTKVGGVPEILPERMIRFADPNPQDIIDVLCEAIPLAAQANPYQLHKEVQRMYNWHDVAARTERVYLRVLNQQSNHNQTKPLARRLERYLLCGPISGLLFAFVCTLDFLLWKMLEWLQPRQDMDLALDLPPSFYRP